MAELSLLRPFEFGEYKRKEELHLKLSFDSYNISGKG